jgi:hypothetical protein
MRKIFCLLVLLFNFQIVNSTTKYVLKIDECLHNKAFEIAEGEVGVVEKTGNNDGEPEKYLKVVGLGKGWAYCAAGISWCYYEAAKFYKKPKSFIPFPMTAGSQVVFDYAKKNGYKSSNGVESKDFFIWRKKDSFQGHIGIIDTVKEKGWVTTIEFNTSGKNDGDQREGGGVFRKKRNLIHPLSKLIYVRGFVGFEKKNSYICNTNIFFKCKLV